MVIGLSGVQFGLSLIASMITDRIGGHRSLITNKNYNFREKSSQVKKEGENSH